MITHIEIIKMKKSILYIIVCITLLVSKINFSQTISLAIVKPTHSFATDIQSLNEAIATEAVGIYPNPFSTSLCISIHNSAHVNTSEFVIYDVFGEMVLSKVLTKQVNMIETCDLPSGVYFYKVLSENKTIQSGRLISQQ